jgi:hypothetical protein
MGDTFTITGNKAKINRIRTAINKLKGCSVIQPSSSNKSGENIRTPSYGDDLNKYIENLQGVRNDEIAEKIIEQLATAIECMHRKGYAHCDIAPQNIAIKQTNPLKKSSIDITLLDLESAILIDTTTVSSSQLRVSKGYTLPYVINQKNNKNVTITINGRNQDLFGFISTLVVVIICISTKQIDNYKHIIDNILAFINENEHNIHNNITIDAFLQLCYANLRTKLYASTIQNYIESNNSITDFDNKILSLLKIPIQKHWLNSLYNTVTNCLFCKKPKTDGGSRTHKKRKTRKHRHQRKASTHSKKQ